MSTLVKSDDAFLGRLFGSEWANRLVMPLPFGEKTIPTQSPSPIPPPIIPGEAHARLLPNQEDDEEDDDQEEDEEQEDDGDDDDDEQEEGDDEQSEEVLPKEEQQHNPHAQLFQDPSHFQALAQERKELNLQKIAKRPREETPIEQREIKMEMGTETMVMEENAYTDKDDDHDDELHEAKITTVEEKIAAASAEIATMTTTLAETTVLGSPTSAAILQRRQRLQTRSQRLLEVITVTIPKEIVGMPKTKDDEDVRTGVVRLFTRHATAILYQQGVVVLRKDGYIFPRKLLTVLRQAATVLQNSIIDRLDETGKIWSALQVPTSSPSQREDGSKADDKDFSFTYKEVASRCLGRLDIRYGMDQPPFNSPQVIQNPWLMPLIYSILGDTAKLVYAGLILSFPGSAKQPWHQDGHPLFPELHDAEEPLADLPPYALNVFIPLTPIESALGPTEFWVASHKESSLKRVQQVLANQQDNDDDDDDDEIFPCLTNDDAPTGVVAPTLNKGDILIYDYRICHRGTENVSTTAVRPMLYLMYARPWFAEHVNFGSTELMESPPPLLPTEWRAQKSIEGGDSAKKVKR